MTPGGKRPALPSPEPPLIHIAPSRGWIPINLPELLQYRDLLYFLVWRDIKLRYKQTILGVAWAILQPLLAMVVFSLFFGRLAGLEQKLPGGTPYPVFAFCGLLPWQLFANALTNAGNSLVAHQNLITKAYFPRLLIPAASVLGGLLDFVIAFLV